MSDSDIYRKRAKIRLDEALGTTILEALYDGDTKEIMANPDGKLFFESTERGMIRQGTIDVNSCENVIRTVASLLNRELPEQSPITSGQLPFYKVRFEGILPPLASGPCFCIRKQFAKVLSLDDLIRRQMLSEEQSLFLTQKLMEHKSVLVCGPTGCGKTTLVNAMLKTIAQCRNDERIISLEDTPELRLPFDNCISLYTSDKTDLCRLLSSSLRLRPDRIVVGEVRGPEALDLVDALTTGHRGGLATLHAGSALQALQRLMLLISRHRAAPRKTEGLIANAFDYIVVLGRIPRLRVREITWVKGFNNDNFILENIEL